MEQSLICLSADSSERLAELVKRVQAGARPSWVASDRARVAIAYDGRERLKAALEAAARAIQGTSPRDEQESGVYYRCDDRPITPPRIAFLYPGQGSQALGMLGPMRSALPSFDRRLRELDDVWLTLAGESLLELIYGESSSGAEARLRDTRRAQPALGMVSTAARLALEGLRVRARFHAGHSYGELPALAGAGFFDFRALLELSRERGRALGEAGDCLPGAMVAISAERAKVDYLLDRGSGGLEVVNLNSPRQFVVAGPMEAVAALERQAAAAGVPAKRLQTSCAFHSSLIEPAASRWQAALERILPESSETPGSRAYSNVTAAAYASSREVVERLAEQIVKPVRWAETCRRLLDDGASIFLEVGPGRVLTDLLSRNLAPGEAPLVASIDSSGEDPERHLMHLLARLASRGVDVDWERFADPAALDGALQLSTPQPAAWQREGAGAGFRNFLESNQALLDKYFAQQASLVEAALPRCPEAQRSALVQAALAANQNVMTQALASQEAAARAGLGASTTAALAPPLAPALPAPVFPGGDTAPAGESPAHIEDALRLEISRATGFPPEAITREVAFTELGVDSLSMAEIWGRLLERMPQLASLAERVLEVRSLADVARLQAEHEAGSLTGGAGSSGAQRPEPPAGEKDLAAEWARMRAQIEQRITIEGGAGSYESLGAADFEKDLGLDVFQRERILGELSAHPRFGQAGRELLNARSLDDLERLLIRFAPPASPQHETQSAADVADEEAVERFVLREEAIPAPSGAGASGAAPRQVIVAGNAGSPDAGRLRDLLESQGISVVPVGVSERTWQVASAQIELDSVEELRRAIEQRTAPKEIAVIFLAEPSADPAADLERNLTALFLLSQALWGEGARPGWADRLVILGRSASPIAEGARGFARSLSRELPSTAVRSLWIESDWSERSDAAWLELLFSAQFGGEVAEAAGRLLRPVLERSPLGETESARPLNIGSRSRIVILGGGDGISAEIGIALAAEFGCEIIAIGRTPAPDRLPHPELPLNFEGDRLLKRRLFEELNAEGRASGEALQREFSRISRQRAIWNTKSRIEQAGGRFAYEQANAADAESLTAAIGAIRSRGPIHGLIHGAGVIRDSLLARKPAADFRAVVETKVLPAVWLRQLLEEEPLEFVYFLSSMSAFTGTSGQTDYAAANEALNAVAKAWNRDRPYPVKSLLWSVWSEAGLAGASLKAEMKRLGLAGIGTKQGVGRLLGELRRGNKSEDWVLFAPWSTLRFCLPERQAPVEGTPPRRARAAQAS